MKLLVVALAALCVVLVSGSADDCGPLQRLKVKHQWYEAYGHGQARIVLGLKIWNKYSIYPLCIVYVFIQLFNVQNTPHCCISETSRFLAQMCKTVPV